MVGKIFVETFLTNYLGDNPGNQIHNIEHGIERHN